MSQAAPYLSVVVPAWEEEARIGDGLGRMLAYLEGRSYSWELIVVEDGSRDRTKALALEILGGRPNARLLSYPERRGKGFGVRQGVLASRGRFVLFLDLDLSVPIETVEPALADLERGWAAVIGSRRLPASEIRAPQAWWRRAGSRIFSALQRGAGLTDFSDTQCGFKALEGEAARRLLARCEIDGFMFDVELLALLAAEGARIKELPVLWEDAAGSRFRPVPDSVRNFADLFSLWRRLRHVRKGAR